MTLWFAGHAALFDRVDRAGDVIRAGAFVGMSVVPLLWQHRGDPIGRIDAIAVDADGLQVAGWIDDPALAAQVRCGAVAGLSIGYRPRRVRQGAYRELLAVNLVEVSLVAVPMQPGARVTRIDG